MTNKIVLRSTEEFLRDYRPAYNPLMPLFMEGAKQYAVEAGQVKFTRVEAVGDLRAKMLGPKDTEIHQVGAKEGDKTFRKYFFGAQFIQSNLQDRNGYEDVVAQVLDEHNKQNDELLLTGEGTANNNVVNNGLYFSADPNYVTKSSVEIDKDGAGLLPNLYAQMISLIEEAEDLDGRLLVLTYGSVFTPVYNGLFTTTAAPFSKVLSDAKPNVDFAKIPSSVTPSGANGYLIINRDQVQLLYTLLPTIRGQGINEEKEYSWTNFLMGSSMIDVRAKGGIIRQPITFEA